jgi:subfamily B ATP-binding cassette protein MsbA
MLSSISIPEAVPLDPTTNDMRITWRLLRYGWKYRGLWVALIISTAAMAALAGYLVMLIKEVLDVMQNAEASPETALGGMHRLGLLALALTPVAALAYGASWFLGQRLANACTRDLRDDLLAHLVQLDLAFHQRLGRGDLLNRMTSDIDATSALLREIFGKVLQRPTEAIGTILFLFYINWRFAAVVFLALTPAAVTLSLLLRKVSRRSHRARRRQAESFTALEQIASGIKVIKAMGSAEAERARYDRANARVYAANMKIALARAQSDALMGGLSFALISVVVLGGALAISQGVSDSSSILTFLTAMIRLTSLMKTGTKVYGEIQENMPAAARLFALLNQKSQIVDEKDAPPCPMPRREIRLEKVRFHYGNQAEILRGLDLTIPESMPRSASNSMDFRRKLAA